MQQNDGLGGVRLFLREPRRVPVCLAWQPQERSSAGCAALERPGTFSRRAYNMERDLTMVYQGTGKDGVVAPDSAASLADGTRVRIETIEQPQTTLGDRLFRHVGVLDDLPSDMAQNHNHYIHASHASE
jgi:hypothetical protein